MPALRQMSATRHPVAALLQNERLLRFRKLRCLHRLPLLPARDSDAENSSQKRSSFPGADHTYGYRRVWALLNRHLRSAGKPTVNMKRVLRIMQNHGLTLERHTARRPDRAHDGVIIALHSNIRWCSDHLELHARNREVVRILFVLDACDREIIAWSAVANAGISGEMVRDPMIAAVERRFKRTCTPHPVDCCPTTEVPTSPRTLPTSRALSA